MHCSNPGQPEMPGKINMLQQYPFAQLWLTGSDYSRSHVLRMPKLLANMVWLSYSPVLSFEVLGIDPETGHSMWINKNPWHIQVC